MSERSSDEEVAEAKARGPVGAEDSAGGKEPVSGNEPAEAAKREGRTARRRRAKKTVAGNAAASGAISSEGETAARTPWHEHKVAIVAITTLFTVLGGISLALFNSWRAPQELSATLAKPTIETNVTLSKGLVASNSPVTGYTEAQLAQVGYLIHVQMKLVGFKGRHTRVRWEMHDADTKARIFFTEWSDEQAAVDVLAEAASDVAAPKFWVPLPPDNQPFFVRVMIDDDKGTELTYADSDAVRPTPATTSSKQ